MRQSKAGCRVDERSGRGDTEQTEVAISAANRTSLTACAVRGHTTKRKVEASGAGMNLNTHHRCCHKRKKVMP